jgi:3-methyladenine DNA glycosylase/8-oxoguanine DNA glycosylase
VAGGLPVAGGSAGGPPTVAGLPESPGAVGAQPLEAVAGVPGLGAGAGVGQPPRASSGELAWCWQPPFALDLVRTLAVHRRGGRDPAFRIDASGAVWRTSLTPAGAATVRLITRHTGTGVFSAPAAWPARNDLAPGTADGAVDGTAGGPGADGAPAVHATAWGPGAAWVIASLPALLGADDDRSGFDPAHPLLRELAVRYHGVLLSRSLRVLEALVPAVLEQKVVGAEAGHAWRSLLLRFGDSAPGPAPKGMRVFPCPDVWRRIPSWEWHRAGVEAVRARTIIGAARVAPRLEEITTMTPAEADRRLRSLPGIGPWTSAEVRQRACGDSDAVSVGDYHLPGAVGWVLAGRKADDAGMLELLAPYAGHRHRVARLIELSGLGPPRRGPRLAVRDYRSF